MESEAILAGRIKDEEMKLFSVGTIGICLAVFSFLTFAQKTTTSPVLKTRAVNHHTGVLLDEYFRRAAARFFGFGNCRTGKKSLVAKRLRNN